MDQSPRSVSHLALSTWLLVSLCLPGTAPAEANENPLRFYEKDNCKSYLQATLNVDLAFFNQDNAWYGQDVATIGVGVNTWWESLVRNNFV